MITKNSDGNDLSAAFLAAVAQPMVRYDLKLAAGGAEVACVVKAAQLSLGAGTVGDLAVADFECGQVLSTQLDAELYDAPSLMGQVLDVLVGVDVGGSFERVRVARVQVATEKVWKGISSIRATGSAGVALSAPAGLSDGRMAPAALAAAIASAAGIAVELGAFADTSQDVAVSASMTCREALSALALNLGGFAAETPDGGMLVSPFSGTATYTMPSDFAVRAPEVQPEDYEVDGVEVTDGLDAWTRGTGRVHMLVPGATEGTADMVWANLGGYGFRPGRLHTALLDPRVTCFDVVSATVDGSTYTVPSLGIEAKFDGGYFGTYSAAGLTAVQEEALREGPVSAQSAEARRIAAEAQAVAEATNQHFWHRSTDPDHDGAGTGAFVTDEDREGFLDAIAHGVQPTTNRPLHNLLMNSQGILLRAAKRIRAAFTPSGVAFYDGQGNDAANVVARFGSDGAQVGKEAAEHMTINNSTVELFNGDDSLAVFGEEARIGQVDGPHIYIDATEYGGTAIKLYRENAEQGMQIGTFNSSDGYVSQVDFHHSFDGGLSIAAQNNMRVDAETIAGTSARAMVTRNEERPSYNSIDIGIDDGEFVSEPYYHSPTIGVRSIDTHQYQPDVAIGFSFVRGQQVETTLEIKPGTLDVTGNIYASGNLTLAGTINASAIPSLPYLPLAGGTLTGQLDGTAAVFSGNVEGNQLTFGKGAAGTRYYLVAKTPSRNSHVLWAGGGAKADGNANGTVLGLGAGGLTIVGGGEYAENRYGLADLNDGDEYLYLGSDNEVYIESNAATIANRHTMTYDKSGNLFIKGAAGHRIDNRNEIVDMTLADNGVSSAVYPGFLMTDVAGRIMSRFESSVNPNGNQGFYCYARNYDANGTAVKQVGFGPIIAKDGTATWRVDEPSAFRTALGLGALALGTASQEGALNCNDLPTGIHYVNSYGTNTPVSGTGGMCVCVKVSSGTQAVQAFVTNNANTPMHVRRYSSNAWTTWRQVG